MAAKDDKDELIGQMISGRYRIISKLGAGGMGTAYRAWDGQDGVPVVIKIPKKIFLEDPKFAERFRREIRLLQGLTHPHIVPITDVGEHEGLPFVAMRYLPGGSLSNRRLRDDNGKVRPNPPGMLHLWLPAVAEALDFVHSQGVVHRDVKPANIFFDAFWGAYLGDFGIAKIVEESDTFDKEHTLTATHMGIGTQEYMCPEQFTPKAVIDGRADQYALAVMVYEMVAGTRPFTGATAHLIVEVTTQQPPPLQVHRRDLPPSLCEAVHRGLSKNPSERFVTCRDFAAAVLQHVQPLADEPGVARLLCPKCSNILKLRDEAAGRKGSCPKCNTQMQVADDLGALWLLDEARRQKKAGSDGERTEEAVGVILADEGGLDAFKPVSGTTPIEKAAIRQKQKVPPVAIWGGLAAAVLAAVVIWGSMPGGKKPRLIPRPPTYEERLAEAEAKLKADPSDWAANETLGLHWCFKEQNWDKGLPYLSKSNAIGFASAAEKELKAKAASPENSGDLVRAAQGWWQVANLPATQKEEATAAVIKKHAAAIYTAAVDGLTVAKDVDDTNRWLDAKPEFLALVGNKRPRAAEPVPAPELTNSVGMKLKLIPAGTFQMGADGEKNGKPVHEVRITTPFYLGVTEVTNAQWKRVMGSEPPSRWKDDNRPVEQVSWDDVLQFCVKLSSLPAEKAAGRVYRLPTEAEWEYACRGGTKTKFSYGDNEGILDDFAWFDGNSGGQTQPVGQKRPNPWGLHDVHGNVWEWCSDRFGPYGAEGASDPTGPATGSARVIRGGCWRDIAGYCRSGYRRGHVPSFRNDCLGFRLALSPSGTSPPESSGTSAADPGTLSRHQASVGQTLCFNVLGSATSGPIWGSNPYTADSRLSRAAVHAGVLRPGEFGVVCVTVLPGQQDYEGSTKNGVTSSPYGPWNLSYRIEGAGEARFQGRFAAPQPILALPLLKNSIGIDLKLIPAGTFLMGSDDGESDEKPVHEVRITKPFYLGVTEVTNAQWRAVIGDAPSKWKDENRPVEQVSWDDAMKFCEKLSALPAEQAMGRVYRLPTEAEWEYACRGGTKTKFSFGNNDANLGGFAWFEGNADKQTHPVGQKRPNPWGLRDMHGNVWEWCSDWYGPYGAEAASDPTGPAQGSIRVHRSGGCFIAAGGCRSASRFGDEPSFRSFTLGFRLALSVPANERANKFQVLRGNPTGGPEIAAAYETLKQNPSDPAANGMIGRHLCFNEEKWPEGLPFLSKGDQVDFARMANAELVAAGVGRSSPGFLVQIAKKWWMLAVRKELNTTGSTQAIRKHAVRLYMDNVTLLKTPLELQFVDTWLDTDHEFRELVKNKRSVEPQEEPESVFLADLEVKTKTAHHYGNKTDAKIGGKTYAHTIYVHPRVDSGQSLLEFAIDGRFDEISGAIGIIDDSTVIASAQVFWIVGDGKELWRSQPFRANGRGEDFRVKISGVKTLELRSESTGPRYGAHCVWIDPRLVKQPEKKISAGIPLVTPTVVFPCGREIQAAASWHPDIRDLYDPVKRDDALRRLVAASPLFGPDEVKKPVHYVVVTPTRSGGAMVLVLCGSGEPKPLNAEDPRPVGHLFIFRSNGTRVRYSANVLADGDLIADCLGDGTAAMCDRVLVGGPGNTTNTQMRLYALTENMVEGRPQVVASHEGNVPMVFHLRQAGPLRVIDVLGNSGQRLGALTCGPDGQWSSDSPSLHVTAGQK